MSQDKKPLLYVFRGSGESLDALDRFRVAMPGDIEAAGYMLIEDDPELDATDGAHPAWWRGHDNGARGMVAVKAKLEARVRDLEAERGAWRDAAYALHDQLISWRGSDEWDDACEAAHKKFREAVQQAAPTTVHILKHGASYCGMPGVPASWPPKHQWISFEDSWEEHATCGACRIRAGLDVGALKPLTLADITAATAKMAASPTPTLAELPPTVGSAEPSCAGCSRAMPLNDRGLCLDCEAFVHKAADIFRRSDERLAEAARNNPVFSEPLFPRKPQ